MKKIITTTRWDAELNTDVCDAYNNADLTLKLRLGFRQINPAGGAAKGAYNDYGDASSPARKIIKWTPGAWNAWIKKFIESAEKFWHGKFWLINNFPEYEYPHKSVTYRPNICCRLDLIGKDASTGTFHHIIDVVRLDPSETWFGSHSTLYDNLDITSVQKNTDSKGKPVMQQAHVHEVGHLLGLGHVDEGKAHCPTTGNTNAAVCYGVADADMQAVMGSGMAIRPEFANPWRKAIIQISGKGTFLTPSDWKAATMRHYPRTLAEVAANRQITARPKR